MPSDCILELLRAGTVIPAHPLALTAQRKLDERHQRALTRYYLAAGAGGIAVGVHTTQFAIRDPDVGLLRPVLELAAEEAARCDRPVIKIAGICGCTAQAVQEATIARDLGYDIGLLSLSAMKHDSVEAMIEHARAVGDVIAIMGFYLQPAVGGCVLPFDFWHRFAELESVVAIKIAPFNRYQTLDVVRGVVEAGREEIALYTGNDDNIIVDLLTPFRLRRGDRNVTVRIVGGLLGHWAVWTRTAVFQLERVHSYRADEPLDPQWLRLNVAVTDANAAFFDAANGFAGCIAGINEVLRRQGLLKGRWCLDPGEDLSPGQSEAIERVYGSYPDLNDDGFITERLDAWLR